MRSESRTTAPPSLARRAAARGVLALALALAWPGTGPALARPAPTPAPAPAWPSPPAAPRLRWLASIASGRDAGARRSLMDRLRATLTGAEAPRLGRPLALCALPGGGFLVSDPGAAAVYECRPQAGTFRVFASGGRLAFPVGIARTPAGDIWVADADRGVIVRYDARGGWKDEVGGGHLVRPTGLACDPASGRVYAADAHAHRVSVFESSGRHVADLGRRGTAPGEFNFPTDVKLAANGDLVVCDAMNARIQRVTTAGQPVTSFGRAGDARGDFGRPKSVAVDADGHVYVVDTLHDVVQVFDPGGQLLLVVGGTGDGPGQFNLPAGIAIGPDHRVYVADTANGRVQVFEYLRASGEGRR